MPPPSGRSGPLLSGRSRYLPSGRQGWPARRWVVVILVLGLVFSGLRLVRPVQMSSAVPMTTPYVVVVGQTSNTQLTRVREELIATRADDLQIGAISVRTRELGDCAAAGWLSLGAGRPTTSGGRCDAAVVDSRVAGWSTYLAAAKARRGDARLGTLAGAGGGCVAAVGPGAALAAAEPDGQVSTYRTVQALVDSDLDLRCPITLIDAGARSPELIQRLAQRPDVTLIVTGVGTQPAEPPALQAIYRVQADQGGWLTSASTRRQGVVTLPDLTATLLEFSEGATPRAGLPIDGARITVIKDRSAAEGFDDHLRSVRNLSDAVLTGYALLGLGGAVLLVIGLVAWARGRLAVTRVIAAFGSILPAAMMSTGATGWQDFDRAGLVLTFAVWLWAALLTVVAHAAARWLGLPVAIAGVGLVVAAFTVDAALGGVMQPGSMLNSRPVFGLRWYGFGNVTFAAYATAALVLAGYLAHRLVTRGRRGAAAAIVAGIGFGVVTCQGWPTMGSDFGGVIALTPPLLWLILTVGGVRITPGRLGAIGAASLLVVFAISVLDWLRGPQTRSHLGNFVQRVIDGDAVDVVGRKAVAAADTFTTPLGVGTLVIGTALWVVIFRWFLPAVRPTFTTVTGVAKAVLATAVLGTLLNDGGISVFLTATGLFTIIMAWHFCDRR